MTRPVCLNPHRSLVVLALAFGLVASPASSGLLFFPGAPWGQGGAARAADDEVVTLVVGLLHEKDKELRALGLDQVRTEAKGADATRRFAAELSKLPPDAQVALLRALTDRGDDAARPDVVKLLGESREEAVRAAAVCALGALGGPADVPALVEPLSSESEPLRRAARRALARLRGEETPGAIALQIGPATATLRVELVEILVARRAAGSVEQIVPLATQKEPSVRAAGMAALGQLAGPEQYPALLRGVVAAEAGSEREAAERALALVAGRVANGPERTKPLLTAFHSLPRSEQAVVLPALGRVGGAEIRQVVDQTLSDQDAARRRAGLSALANWPDVSAVERLMETVQSEVDAADKAIARGALIRLAPIPDKRTPAERLALTQKVMTLCQNDAEKNLLLKRCRAIRSVETLRYLVGYLDQPAFAAAAGESIVELAHHRELRDAHKAEFFPALERLIQTSQDATVVERAGRYLKNQTWARPGSEQKGGDSGGC